MEGGFVAGVNSNTPVPNAQALTQAQSVILLPAPTTSVGLLTGRSVEIQMPLPLLCKPVTPVKSNRLKFYLTDYDPTLKRYLLDGFLEGFNVHCLTKPSHLDSKNLKSAFENPTAVALKLGKELEAGRLAGPFTKPPFPNFCTSPLGIVPKKAPGEFRLIHHLSYPHGSSVNDGIPKELSSVQYATINHAIQHIRTFGPGCWMAKTDIKSAFRIIPVHPAHRFPFTGYEMAG